MNMRQHPAKTLGQFPDATRQLILRLAERDRTARAAHLNLNARPTMAARLRKWIANAFAL